MHETGDMAGKQAGRSRRHRATVATIALGALAATAGWAADNAASGEATSARTAPVSRSGSPSAPASGSSDDVSNAPTSAASPGDVTTSNAPAASVQASHATEAIRSALALEATALGPVRSRPTVPAPTKAQAMTPYQEALAATAAEFDRMGWTRTGAPTVDRVAILRRDERATPPRVEVLACLDSRGVDILDATGTSLRNAASPVRSAQIFTLEWVGGTWQVAEATFPDDADC